MRSIKVLFFATRDWFNPATTGGDNTLWENARYLASVGHEVTYLASTFPGAASKEKLDGINVVRLGRIHSLWARTFLYYMSHCRGKFDVVVTEGFGGSRIPRMAPLYVREPVITSWHQIHRDLFAAQYPRLLVGPLTLLERVTAWVHRNTWVQAYTPEWKAAFPQIGFKSGNVFVVPPSIREEWLTESNGYRPALPTILWIGKLRRYKCPDHVVRAMSDLVKRIPSARLMLVGRHDDLKYEQQLRLLVVELGLEPNVEFRLDINEREKRGLLQESTVLVLPSAVEGFGIVVLEANACGIPVVASTGVPEGAVCDHYNGLRYPFGKIDSLAQRLVEILTNDDLYGRLSANSYEFARRFSWLQVSHQYAEIVERAVNKKPLYD